MKIYSLFDVKVREVGSLVLASNDAACMRALKEGLGNGKSTVELYPEDFELVCLGDLNVETGIISPELDRRFVARVADILKRE